VTGIGVLRDRAGLFGPLASMPTAWRLLCRIDAAHPGRVRAARAAARERASYLGNCFRQHSIFRDVHNQRDRRG